MDLENLVNIDDPDWFDSFIQFEDSQTVAMRDYLKGMSKLSFEKFNVSEKQFKHASEHEFPDVLSRFLRESNHVLDDAIYYDILEKFKLGLDFEKKILAFQESHRALVPKLEKDIEALDSVALFNTLKNNDEASRKNYDMSLEAERKLKHSKNVIAFIDKVLPKFYYELSLLHFLKYSYSVLISRHFSENLDNELNDFIDKEISEKVLPLYNEITYKKEENCRKYSEGGDRFNLKTGEVYTYNCGNGDNNYRREGFANRLYERFMKGKLAPQSQVKNNGRTRL